MNTAQVIVVVVYILLFVAMVVDLRKDLRDAWASAWAVWFIGVVCAVLLTVSAGLFFVASGKS